jgi:type IV pilus assembly protein PilP
MAANHFNRQQMITVRLHNYRLSLVLLLAAPLLLTACSGEQHGDLVAYVNKVKTRQGSNIEPLPEVKPYETFVYIDQDRRDPFSQYIEEIRKPETADTGLTPDILKYVGTLEKKGIVWALISAPDNTVYRVQVGNHMGANYGEILEITETEVKLKEIIPNGATGGWVDRTASLSLSE